MPPYIAAYLFCTTTYASILPQDIVAQGLLHPSANATMGIRLAIPYSPQQYPPVALLIEGYICNCADFYANPCRNEFRNVSIQTCALPTLYSVLGWLLRCTRDNIGQRGFGSMSQLTLVSHADSVQVFSSGSLSCHFIQAVIEPCNWLHIYMHAVLAVQRLISTKHAVLRSDVKG